MQLTDNYQLPCLGQEDYAAHALYMQCLALKLEQEFTERQDLLTGFTHRPVALWRATAAVTGIPDNVQWTLGGLSNIFAHDWPAVVTSSPTIPALRGWWQVSACVNPIASGAVTLNSERRLTTRVNAATGSPIDTPDQDFVDQSWESNSGNGENLLTTGTVYFAETGSTSDLGRSIDTFLFHTNTGSTLNTTLTPAQSVWVIYLGDTPEIQGVV